MIPVSAELFLTMPFFFFFFALVLLWLREELRRRKEGSEWMEGKNRLYLCDKCHLSFLAKPGQSVTRCPRCNEMCFLRRRKRF